VKKCLKSVNIWQSYQQERGCLVHFVRLANALLKAEENAGDNQVLAKYERKRKCTLTWFIDAEFGDAEYLGLGVQTLDDDVLRQLVGLRAVDGEHLSSKHRHGHRATDLVRGRLHCRTRRRKAIHVSDVEVVQTIHCNNANRLPQCMYTNIAMKKFLTSYFFRI